MLCSQTPGALTETEPFDALMLQRGVLRRVQQLEEWEPPRWAERGWRGPA